MMKFPDKTDTRPQRFGWAPGSYICRCFGAGCAKKPKSDRGFIGDKRAIMCADCAYALPDAPPRSVPSKPVASLREAAEEAVSRLGAWLTDNTDEAFEEESEIDSIRTLLHDALQLP